MFKEDTSAKAPKKASTGGKKSTTTAPDNSGAEKSTLGDLDALSALKEKMEGDSNK